MLKLECLGTISDKSIKKIRCSGECIEIHIDFDDLNSERQNKVFKDLSKEYPDTYDTLEFTSIAIWVNVDLPKKTFIPSLAIEYTDNKKLIDLMEWDIHFTATEWSIFIKEIILPFFEKFKMKVTDYD